MVVVKEFSGAKVSPDGETVILAGTTPGDEPVEIEVSACHLPIMFTLLQQADNQAKASKDPDPRRRFAVPVDWWEIAAVPEYSAYTVSFRSPWGLEMTYVLPHNFGNHMLEVLSQVLALLGGDPEILQTVPPGRLPH